MAFMMSVSLYCLGQSHCVEDRVVFGRSCQQSRASCVVLQVTIEWTNRSVDRFRSDAIAIKSTASKRIPVVSQTDLVALHNVVTIK